MITDGKQTTTLAYTRLSEASRGMKNKGVIVYAVGVGSGADAAELEEIASGSKYVYTSASFKDLQNIAPEIRKRLCGGNLWINIRWIMWYRVSLARHNNYWPLKRQFLTRAIRRIVTKS